MDSKIIDCLMRIYREDTTKIQLEESRYRNINKERDKTRVQCINGTVETDYILNYRRNNKNRKD